MVLTVFMFVSRFLEYRYAVSATFTLISFGEFFMNIALIVIIVRTKNFKFLAFGRDSEPNLGTTSTINYRNMDESGGAVVIQPLPERPGPWAETGPTVTNGRPATFLVP